jgi:hypothetical protein
MLLVWVPTYFQTYWYISVLSFCTTLIDIVSSSHLLLQCPVAFSVGSIDKNVCFFFLVLFYDTRIYSLHAFYFLCVPACFQAYWYFHALIFYSSNRFCSLFCLIFTTVFFWFHDFYCWLFLLAVRWKDDAFRNGAGFTGVSINLSINSGLEPSCGSCCFSEILINVSHKNQTFHSLHQQIH